MNELEYLILIATLLSYSFETIWRLHGRLHALATVEFVTILMQSAYKEAGLIIPRNGKARNGLHHGSVEPAIVVLK